MATDVVIAVMGLTGAGKSSFVKNVTGREDVKVGHGLVSETSEIGQYECTHLGRRYVLIDTPGFDDTFDSDVAITEKILSWLESSYRAGTKLDGIIYLHSIAQPRMSGSAFDNLCMFRKLCGNDCLNQVILATTFWDVVPSDDASKRVTQLQEDKLLWGRMVDAGSRVVKLQNDRRSALTIMSKIAPDSKMVLQAQREMVDEGKTAQQTAAGKFTASHGGNTGFREREERLKQLGVASRLRADELAKMKQRLQSTDQQLEATRLDVEKQRLALVPLRAKPDPALPGSKMRSPTRRRCRCKSGEKVICATCKGTIGKSYYHCCLCTDDGRKAFVKCLKCGSHCGNPEHVDMSQEDAYCIVM